MKSALASVNDRIRAAVQKRSIDFAPESVEPRLVAVSKLQPISAIVEAYECGQRHFGESYIQELEEKSNSEEILTKCPDIKFHLIGHIQSNKVNKLFKIKNLFLVESVDSVKLADLINRTIDNRRSGNHAGKTVSFNLPDEPVDNFRLKVLLQVNTSLEEKKHGCHVNEAVEIAKHIYRKCPNLEFRGVMTVGKLGSWGGDGQNLDFVRLYMIRTMISKAMGIDQHTLELSMGMSDNFEHAVDMGCTNVRIGTLIFGQRPTKEKEKEHELE